MKIWQPTLLACALTAAFPLTASAQSNADLLKEIQALKSRVAELEAAQKSAAKPTSPQWGMTPQQTAEFNRIAVKTEALEDNIEAQGLKSLKISGVIDPTYIYNRAQNTASFAFLNNFASSTEVFAYDNSYFGMAVVDFQKELEGGSRWRLTLAPHKSVGSNYNFPSIVHEASISIPVTDLATRFWAGQLPDWSGYEYYLANQTKLITHNMMFDFLAPTYYSGIGTDVTSGKWQVKTFLGNMNASRYNPGEDGKSLKSPVFSARIDYSKGEYNGWGSAVQIGKAANAVAGGNTLLQNFEVDGYFIRGDLTLQGQINYGKQAKAAYNGGDARWAGFSALGAFKLTPRLEVSTRIDYLNNSRNGGGTFNITGFTRDDSGTLVGPDSRNGFGPGMVQDATTGAWSVGDANTGANRYSVSLGVNYALTSNALLKTEYRLDGANLPVFMYLPDGDYRKRNQLFGASVVVSF
jgi:hypothetical protein